MTDSPTPPAKPDLPALTAPPPRHGGARQPLALWLSLAALLGVGVLAWLAWQGENRLAGTRAELARRLAAGETAQQEAQANARQNREALDALQAKVGALEAQLAETQSQQMALDAMYQELSRVREDRLLAETEQEVAIAAQQLQLAGNVEAALIALQGADARLARNAQPQFLPLRKLIARDIERLKALPGADVPGIALKLDAILHTVDSLPLAFEQRPKETPPAQSPPSPSPSRAGGETVGAVPPALTFDAMVRAWFADLWGELRQLVRIERIDRPDPGLLAPRETFFLRENLRLRLLAARLALLARDGRSFQSDVGQAAEWLDRYFDTRAPAVQEARTALAALGKLDVMREPVELNETLSALRNFKLARDPR
ncbi:MAG: uroporphyrinogen-III C-methyltransferase [Pseudomonadota bacterium]